MEGSGAMSLLQFTTLLGNVVRTAPGLQSTWVTAEISDLRVAGGHCYMELVEKNGAGSTVAKMRAMIWANSLGLLRRKFFAATGRDIANGLKVMFRGSASHHPVYGLSFTIHDIDPSYTLGDMERLRREILEKLRREGIVDNNKDLHFPDAPQRIAVISAEGAAGYGDFINHLSSSAEGFVFYPRLFQAVMQGGNTGQSVRGALSRVRDSLKEWDCVVIIRGGGATTDLNGFDDYELAREVAMFPLPIVVGIGHERDRTVLDEIACVRCKTPTAVASFLIDRLRESFSMVSGLVDMVIRFASEHLKGEGMRLSNLSALIPALAGQRLSENRSFLNSLASRIPVVASSRIASERSRLDSMRMMVASLAAQRCMSASQRLGDITARLRQAAEFSVMRGKSRLQSFEELVKALSPENTLRRGYSVTYLDGKAVRSSMDLRPGDRIETKLFQGSVFSDVSECSDKKNND